MMFLTNTTSHQTLSYITNICLLLALTVIILGAYTRLKDAGLGCPDWPTCYGSVTVPSTTKEITSANIAYPERPVEPEKAWPEMIHRYLAGLFMLAIFFITYLSYKWFRNIKSLSTLALGMSVLVIAQALLGMWTVTLKLSPIIVMAHLLGGFSLISLLFLFKLKLLQTAKNNPAHKSATYATVERSKERSHIKTKVSSKIGYIYIGLALLILQIALGGWTAANYAASVCTQLPICQGEWWRWLQLREAFAFWSFQAPNYEFGPHLSPAAKITIHVSHRIGAILVTGYLLFLAAWLLKRNQPVILRQLTKVLLLLLACQVSLGITNILAQLPLAVAVAHNALAALLLLTMVAICYYSKILIRH